MSCGRIDPAFWQGRRVFVTGHTGFKGGWLVAMLDRLGATVCGYALAPETEPNLFTALAVADHCDHHEGDIRDAAAMTAAVAAFKPEIVLHLAAQALVRRSYRDPLETFQTNVMGTANLLEACRDQPSVKVVVVITTDKVYENKHWNWGYRESDRLGGSDPYSASKAAAEIVVESWRRSFLEGDGIVVATARAGNVIGGGDWSEDRIVPDAVRAFAAGKPLGLRNPDSIRPWQHVTDSLAGYLMLAEACWRDAAFGTAWNFGPDPGQVAPVRRVADLMVAAWEPGQSWENQAIPGAPKEAAILLLDSAQARAQLGWQPSMSLDTVIATTMEWYGCFLAHGPGPQLQALTAATIADALGLVHR